MTSVVTVINAPAAKPLTAADMGRARSALQHAGATVTSIDWLGRGAALDALFGGITLTAAEAALRTILKDRPVDVVAQPTAHRRKRLLVADMDSTIIGQECLDELAARIGVGEQVAMLTERAMRGEIDFAGALIERVALFKDQPESLLERTYTEAVTLNSGARTLTATMRKAGAHCALVSGGFTFFTSRVANAAGFDSFIGNEFEIRAGKLTGRIKGAIAGADAKRERLQNLMFDLNVAVADTLALGDGANDIPMLQAAGLGLAYHAKPKVRDAVTARLDHADLTGVLYVQGYRREEFVEA